MGRTIILFYKNENHGLGRLWTGQGHIPSKQCNQPRVLVRLGWPFWRQGNHLLSRHLQEVHITEEGTGSCSRLAGRTHSLDDPGLCVWQKPHMPSLLPNKNCTTGLCRICVFVPPSTDWFLTWLWPCDSSFSSLLVCLGIMPNRVHQTPRVFLAFVHCFKKGLLVYALDHFILLASGFVWDYSCDNSLGSHLDLYGVCQLLPTYRGLLLETATHLIRDSLHSYILLSDSELCSREGRKIHFIFCQFKTGSLMDATMIFFPIQVKLIQ